MNTLDLIVNGSFYLLIISLILLSIVEILGRVVIPLLKLFYAYKNYKRIKEFSIKYKTKFVA